MGLGFLVAAGVGALSGGLGALLVPRERKTLRIVVVMAGCMIVTPLLREFVVKPWEVDAGLQEVEVFRVIKQREPEVYDAIRAETLAMARPGLDKAELQAKVMEHLAPLAKKYIALAEDEVLRRYIGAVVKQIDALRQRDPVVARKFLFPVPGEVVLVQDYVDKETQKEVTDALAALIESGAGASPHADDAERSNELLQGAVARLRTTYGEDLALMSRPYDPETDPARLAAIVSDLYRELLLLPVVDSALVLRSVLSEV